MRWYIVAFRHREGKEHSVLYLGDIGKESLVRAVLESIERGADLMSIRGIPDAQSQI